MKNFDEQRAARALADRGFQIGGETFTRKASVRPEATEPWEAITLESTSKETLANIDETVCNMIEPGVKGADHKRWLELRKREEDAVTMGDLLELVQWLIAEQSARPTEQPSSSSVEPEELGTSLTEDSSSTDSPEEPEPSTSDNS